MAGWGVDGWGGSAALTYIVNDPFTRADSSTTMGTEPVTSTAYTYPDGTWGITTNRAYCVAGNASPGYGEATVDPGALSFPYTIECDLTLSSTFQRANAGLCFHSLGSRTAGLFFVKAEITAGNPSGLWIIGKHDGGVFYGTGANPALNEGDTYHITVTIDATSITAKIVGTGVDSTVTYTKTGADQTKFNSATPFGLRIRVAPTDEDDLGSRWDNLQLSTGGGAGGAGWGGGAPPAGLTVPFNQSLETDTAHQFRVLKTKALGQSSETDTSQPITQAGSIKAFSQAIETDTATIFSFVKSGGVVVTPPSGGSSAYKFVIADLNGNELDEIPAENPQWSYVLNDSGAANLVLPTRHPKCTQALLPVGQRELHIYKEGVLIWGGHLWAADSSIEDTTRFAFEGYFGRLKRRYIDVTRKYEDDDQFDIVWDLINWAQNQTNGDIGITRYSNVASGYARSVTFPFWERANIGTEIIGMSEMNHGFDFEVTPDKKWKAYYPRAGVDLPIPFELGKNISGISIAYDASDMGTEFTAIGAGDGKNTCIAVASAPSQAALYGLLEQSESFTNIKKFASLQDRADARIKRIKKPRVQPSLSVQANVEPELYTFSVGDRVDVKAQDGYINIDKQLRIISVVVALSNEGREAVTVQFDEETEA